MSINTKCNDINTKCSGIKQGVVPQNSVIKRCVVNFVENFCLRMLEKMKKYSNFLGGDANETVFKLFF